MASEIKTIKNTLGVPQSVVYKGRQFVLGPNDEQTFEAVIAALFLEKCNPVVVEVKMDLGGTYAPDLQAKTVWVANYTGNPDAPKTVKDRRFDKTIMRYAEVDAPNPNIEARAISRECKGGHKQYTARDGGLVQESLPSRTWVVPPYRRVPMPEDAAGWFIQRDAMSGLGRGACIISRPRSEFEPDMTWIYEDMRNYARLTDPSMDIGPDHDALVAMVKTEVDKLAKDGLWKPRKIEVELKERSKEALRLAKQRLFQRLYYRLVNPDYILPTRASFNEFVTGRSQDDIDEAEVEKLLAQADRLAQKQQASLTAEQQAVE